MGIVLTTRSPPGIPWRTVGRHAPQKECHGTRAVLRGKCVRRGKSQSMQSGISEAQASQIGGAGSQLMWCGDPILAQLRVFGFLGLTETEASQGLASCRASELSSRLGHAAMWCHSRRLAQSLRSFESRTSFGSAGHHGGYPVAHDHRPRFSFTRSSIARRRIRHAGRPSTSTLLHSECLVLRLKIVQVGTDGYWRRLTSAMSPRVDCELPNEAAAPSRLRQDFADRQRPGAGFVTDDARIIQNGVAAAARDAATAGPCSI